MHPEADPRAEVHSLGSFRPDLLTLARQSRGLTQGELAKHTGISQPTISRLEEQAIPTDKQLALLAAALGYPERFFVQPDPIYGFGVGELFHRRRKTIPMRVLDRVHAEMNIRAMVVRRLLKSVDLPDLDLPIVDQDATTMSPADAARVLRARWHLPTGPVRSVTDVLERSGVLVIPGDFSTPLVDAIGHWPFQSPPLAFFNPTVPQDRLRLTLMHEVGHFVLHARSGLDLGPEIEQQANAFAAEFLMPAEEIGPQLRELNLPKLAHLKRHWRVSMAALLVRAKETGAIPLSRYRSLWTDMGKLGYRQREPQELDVQGEQLGSTFREIIRLHLDDLQYSVDELAAHVLLDPQEFQERYLGKRGRPRLIRFG